MKKISFIKTMVVVCILSLTTLSFYHFATDSQLLFAGASSSDKPLRLHILANSDSAYDQELKKQLRDYIIALLEPELVAAENKAAAMKLIERELPELTEACNDFLMDKANYQAVLALERTDFPQIDYDGMVFAAGEYDALRIILGEGNGKNWWCVLFPPLCFVDLAAEYSSEKAVEVMAASYTDEQNSGGIQIKWKLSELFSRK